MIPRLDISFPPRRQWQYWFGKPYIPKENELLLNHARSGIVLALRAALPNGGRVGLVTYNCHTVANAIVSANCTPVFLDVDDNLRINLHRGTVPVCKSENLDAIVVTNLFGIQNDIAAIRKACPKAVIIVDNAHGYGLPPEGDFTIYSINQGKYPALGPGGILIVNNPQYCGIITQWGQSLLCKIGFIRQIKEFTLMLIKSILYHPWIYGWFTMQIKAFRANNADHTPVTIKAMSPGVSRLYKAWLNDNHNDNHKLFMDVIHTKNPEQVIAEYKAKGIEADTHFKYCIRWAMEFGYIKETCPNAERLLKELVMVPNYFKNK